MKIQHRALILAIILICTYVCAFIIKYIELHNSSFIGNKARKYVIYFNILSILQHSVLEVIFVVIGKYYSIGIIAAIPYMFISLYNIFMCIINIRNSCIENKHSIEIVSNIVKGIVKEKKYGVSYFKLLTQYGSKVEFQITYSDALRLKSLLEEQSVISKIHYYKSSGRIYGVEMLRYQKIT